MAEPVQEQGDGRLAALISNVEAVRAMARAVEGTLGPKGLDTMLVGREGEVLVTNDGVTILTEMDATHPAARMVVAAARAQEQAVGDGTTTTTVMAGALLGAALEHALRGVPVARLIDGIRQGEARAEAAVRALARPLAGVGDPLLAQVARVAGRGEADIAALVTEAARLWGKGRLGQPGFCLADCVLGQPGVPGEVFPGVLISKGRMDRQQPREVRRVRALVLDDALAPVAVEEEALATEAGFRQYQENRRQFVVGLKRLLELGVNLVLCDRGIDDEAAELLTDAGVLAVQRVTMAEWQRAAEYLGARVVRRSALLRDPAELKRCLGRARRAWEEEHLEQIRLLGGAGRPMATVLVGAATPEVAAERERIARDAAAAAQAALREGVVPGGGAVELAAARAVAGLQQTVAGLSAYGVACMVEALRQPPARIAANAGLSPLEKVGEVWAAQNIGDTGSLGLDCERGVPADMWALGVVDPAAVKVEAIRTAAEIAAAILRIETVVRKKAVP